MNTAWDFRQIHARSSHVRAFSQILKRFARIATGTKPGEKVNRPKTRNTEALTLGQSWQRYEAAHLLRKGRSTKTILEYEKHINGVLSERHGMIIN